MDFSALIADLRTIAGRYNGRDTDRNVSTAMYCEMFRKILQKAENGVTEYGDQIVILWMTLSQLCNTYQTLTSCPARDSLYQHIFLLCAKVVLNIKWQQLPEDDQGKVNFSQTIANTHQHLVKTGFNRFELLTHLMENPWTDPTLSMIMSGNDKEESSGSDTETEETEREKERKMKEKKDDIANYINKEDSLILKLRVEMLILENCEDFASNLCNCLVKYNQFKDDLDLREMQFRLLYKLNQMDRLQEECEEIVCHSGIKIINRLEQKESNQQLCIRLVQVFLVQDWINPDRNCCTKELLKLWIRHQYMADRDRTKFLENVWSIAKLSLKTDQICLLITGLQKECGAKLRQLYTDLCVYAINIDKGGCEKEMMQGNMDVLKERQKAMAVTCEKLAGIVAMTNLKAAKISALTAFALNPMKSSLHLVEKMYLNKTINQASHRKKEKLGRVKDKRETHDGDVNLATLYEVERLLNMLRPYYLNPDLQWQELLPVCQKFMAEKGGTEIKDFHKEPKDKMSTSLKDGLMQYYCDDTAQFIPAKQTAKDSPSSSNSPPKSPWTSVSNIQNKLVKKDSTKLIPYAKLQNVPGEGPIDMSKTATQKPPNTPKTKPDGQIKRGRGRPCKNPSFDFAKLLEATKNLPQMQSKPSISPGNLHLPYVPGLTTQEVEQAMLLQKKNYSRSLSVDQLTAKKHNSSMSSQAYISPSQSHRTKALSLERQQSGHLQLQQPTSAATDLSKTSHRPRILPDRNQDKSSTLLSFKDSFVSNVNQRSLDNIIQSNQIEVANEVTLNSATGSGQTTATPIAAPRSRKPSKEELQSIVDWLQTGTEDARVKPKIVVKQTNEQSIGLVPKQKKQNTQENLVQYVSFGSNSSQMIQNTEQQQGLRIQAGVSKNFASQVMSKIGIKPGMTEEEINIAKIKAIMAQKQLEIQQQEQQKQKKLQPSKGFLLIPGSAQMVMQSKLQGQKNKTKSVKSRQKKEEKKTSTATTGSPLSNYRASMQNVGSHQGYSFVNQMIQSSKPHTITKKGDLSTQQTYNLGAQPIATNILTAATTAEGNTTSKTTKFRDIDIQHALQSLSKVLDKSNNVLNQNTRLQEMSKKSTSEKDLPQYPVRPASAMPSLMSSTTIVVTTPTNTSGLSTAHARQTLKSPQKSTSGQNSAYQLLYLGQIKTGSLKESGQLVSQVQTFQQTNASPTVAVPSFSTVSLSSGSGQGTAVNTFELQAQNVNQLPVGLQTVTSQNVNQLPVGLQTVTSQHVNQMPVGLQTVTSQNVNQLPVGLQTVTSQNVNQMPLGLQTVTSQNVNQMPLGLQTVTSQNVNQMPLGLQTVTSQNLNQMPVGLQTVTSQNVNQMPVGFQTVTSQNVNQMPVGLQTVNSHNVKQMPLGLQAVTSQNVSLQGFGAQTGDIQNYSTQNMVVQGIGAALPAVQQINTSVLGSSSVNTSNLMVQGITAETIESPQNIVVQGIDAQQVVSVQNLGTVTQPIEFQSFNSHNQSVIQNISAESFNMQGVANLQAQTLTSNQTGVIITQNNQGQSMADFHSNDLLDCSNLLQAGANINMNRIVPNTTVTFTTSTGLMSTKVSTLTSTNMVCTSVNSVNIPTANMALTQSPISTAASLVTTNVDNISNIISGEASSNIGNLLISNQMPEVSSLNVVSTNYASDAFMQQQGQFVLPNTANTFQSMTSTKPLTILPTTVGQIASNMFVSPRLTVSTVSSNRAVQPFNILADTNNVLVGPFQLITNTSVNNTTSPPQNSSSAAYLIPATSVQSISSSSTAPAMNVGTVRPTTLSHGPSLSSEGTEKHTVITSIAGHSPMLESMLLGKNEFNTATNQNQGSNLDKETGLEIVRRVSTDQLHGNALSVQNQQDILHLSARLSEPTQNVPKVHDLTDRNVLPSATMPNNLKLFGNINTERNTNSTGGLETILSDTLPTIPNPAGLNIVDIHITTCGQRDNEEKTQVVGETVDELEGNMKQELSPQTMPDSLQQDKLSSDTVQENFWKDFSRFKERMAGYKLPSTSQTKSESQIVSGSVKSDSLREITNKDETYGNDNSELESANKRMTLESYSGWNNDGQTDVTFGSYIEKEILKSMETPTSKSQVGHQISVQSAIDSSVSDDVLGKKRNEENVLLDKLHVETESDEQHENLEKSDHNLFESQKTETFEIEKSPDIEVHQSNILQEMELRNSQNKIKDESTLNIEQTSNNLDKLGNNSSEVLMDKVTLNLMESAGTDYGLKNTAKSLIEQSDSSQILAENVQDQYKDSVEKTSGQDVNKSDEKHNDDSDDTDILSCDDVPEELVALPAELVAAKSLKIVDYSETSDSDEETENNLQTAEFDEKLDVMENSIKNEDIAVNNLQNRESNMKNAPESSSLVVDPICYTKLEDVIQNTENQIPSSLGEESQKLIDVISCGSQNEMEKKGSLEDEAVTEETLSEIKNDAPKITKTIHEFEKGEKSEPSISSYQEQNSACLIEKKTCQEKPDKHDKDVIQQFESGNSPFVVHEDIPGECLTEETSNRRLNLGSEQLQLKSDQDSEKSLLKSDQNLGSEQSLLKSDLNLSSEQSLLKSDLNLVTEPSHLKFEQPSVPAVFNENDNEQLVSDQSRNEMDEKSSNSFHGTSSQKTENVLLEDKDETLQSIKGRQSENEEGYILGSSVKQIEALSGNDLQSTSDILLEKEDQIQGQGHESSMLTTSDEIIECEKQDGGTTPPKNDLMAKYKMLMDEMLNLSSSKNPNDNDPYSASKSFGFDELEKLSEERQNGTNESASASFPNFAFNKLPENCIPGRHLTRSLPDDWTPGQTSRNLERSISDDERTLKRSYSDIDLSLNDGNLSDIETQSVVSRKGYRRDSRYNLLYNPEDGNQLTPAEYRNLHLKYNCGKYALSLPQLGAYHKRSKREISLLTYGEWKNKDGTSENITPPPVPLKNKTINTEELNVDLEEKEQENTCLICRKMFKTMEELRQHVINPCRPTDLRKVVHESKELGYETVYTCTQCKNIAKSEYAAKRHSEVCVVYRSSDSKYNIDTIFRCKMCGETFKYHRTACEHVTFNCKMKVKSSPKKSAVENSEMGQNISSSSPIKMSSVGHSPAKTPPKCPLDRSKESLVSDNKMKEGVISNLPVENSEIIGAKDSDIEVNPDLKPSHLESTPGDSNGKKTKKKDKQDKTEAQSLAEIKHAQDNKSRNRKAETEKDNDNDSVKSFSTESSYMTIDASETSSIKSGEYKTRSVPPKQSVRLISKQIGKRVIKVKKFFGDQFEVPKFVETQVKKVNLKRKFKPGNRSGLNISPKFRRALRKKELSKAKKKLKLKKQIGGNKKMMNQVKNTAEKDEVKKSIHLQEMFNMNKEHILKVKNCPLNLFSKNDSKVILNSLYCEKNGKKVLRCPIRVCRSGIITKKGMVLHAQKVHHASPYKSKGKNFECKYCEVQCDRRDAIIEHSIDHYVNFVVDNIEDCTFRTAMLLSSCIEKKNKLNNKRLKGAKFDSKSQSIDEKTGKCVDENDKKSISLRKGKAEYSEKQEIKKGNKKISDELPTLKLNNSSGKIKKSEEISKGKSENQKAKNKMSEEHSETKQGHGEIKRESRKGKIRKSNEAGTALKEVSSKSCDNMEVHTPKKTNDIVFKQAAKEIKNLQNCDSEKSVQRRSSRKQLSLATIKTNKYDHKQNKDDKIKSTDKTYTSETGESDKTSDCFSSPDSSYLRRSSRRKTDGFSAYKDFEMPNKKLKLEEGDRVECDQSGKCQKPETRGEESEPSVKPLITRGANKNDSESESQKTTNQSNMKKSCVKEVKSEHVETPSVRNPRKRHLSRESDLLKICDTKEIKTEDIDTITTRKTRKRHLSLDSCSSKTSVRSDNVGENRKDSKTRSDNIVQSKNNTKRVKRKNADEEIMSNLECSILTSRKRANSLGKQEKGLCMKKSQFMRNSKARKPMEKQRFTKKNITVHSTAKIKKDSKKGHTEKNNINEDGQESNAFLESFKQFVGISRKTVTSQIKSLKQGKSNKLKAKAIMHHRRQTQRKSKVQEKSNITDEQTVNEMVEVVDLIEIKDFRNKNKAVKKDAATDLEVIDLTEDTDNVISKQEKKSQEINTVEENRNMNCEKKAEVTTNNYKKSSFLDSFLAHVSETTTTVKQTFRDKKLESRKCKNLPEKDVKECGKDGKSKENMLHDKRQSSKSDVQEDKKQEENLTKPTKDQLKCSAKKVESESSKHQNRRCKKKAAVEEKKEDQTDVERQKELNGQQNNTEKRRTGRLSSKDQDSSVNQQNVDLRNCKSPDSFQNSFMTYIDSSDPVSEEKASKSVNITLKVPVGEEKKPKLSRKKSPFKWDLDEDETEGKMAVKASESADSKTKQVKHSKSHECTETKSSNKSSNTATCTENKGSKSLDSKSSEHTSTTSSDKLVIKLQESELTKVSDKVSSKKREPKEKFSNVGEEIKTMIITRQNSGHDISRKDEVKNTETQINQVTKKTQKTDFENHFVQFVSSALNTDSKEDKQAESNVDSVIGINDNDQSKLEKEQNSAIDVSHSATGKDSKTGAGKTVSNETKSSTLDSSALKSKHSKSVSSTLDRSPLKSNHLESVSSKRPDSVLTSKSFKSISSEKEIQNFTARYNLPTPHSKKAVYSTKSFVVRKNATNKKLIPLSVLKSGVSEELPKTVLELSVAKSENDKSKSQIMESSGKESPENSEGKVKTSTSHHKLVPIAAHRVRHMYHGGKVWQIGQGSVSAMNLASPAKSQNSTASSKEKLIRVGKNSMQSDGQGTHVTQTVDTVSVKGDSQKEGEKQSRWKARKSPQKRPASSDINIHHGKRTCNAE